MASSLKHSLALNRAVHPIRIATSSPGQLHPMMIFIRPNIKDTCSESPSEHFYEGPSMSTTLPPVFVKAKEYKLFKNQLLPEHFTDKLRPKGNYVLGLNVDTEFQTQSNEDLFNATSTSKKPYQLFNFSGKKNPIEVLNINMYSED